MPHDIPGAIRGDTMYLKHILREIDKNPFVQPTYEGAKIAIGLESIPDEMLLQSEKEAINAYLTEWQGGYND